MNDAFDVRGGSIAGPSGLLLRDLTLSVPERGITAILGPAGCGKSKLLQALEGSLPGGWRRHGSWSRSTDAIRHVPQRRSESGDWRFMFDDSVDVLMLDEVDRTVPFDQHEELAMRLRDAARRAAVVLVTHNLALARAAADRVVLLCDGAIVECGAAPEFFADPRHPLARRFVAEGNCWPPPRQPELPSHFRWLIPGQLAGMGRPGLLRDEDDDLFAIASNGISLLVSLTEKPFPPERLRSFGITSRHFPINDMGVPPRAAAARLCRAIEKTIEQGSAVAVHCLAGRGRTGTILAAFLVWKGARASDAIAQVRVSIDGAIQTTGQLAFVREFEELG